MVKFQVVSPLLLSVIIAVEAFQIRNIGVVEAGQAGPCPDGFTGLIPHPTFCPFYYFCVDGMSTLRECTAGLYFNPRAKNCDYSDNVPECTEGTRTTTSWETSSTIQTTTEGPETEGTVGTGSTLISSTTTAPITTPQPPTTSRPTTPEGLTCPDHPSIFMPFPGECNKYYLCRNGTVVSIHECQQNLWFKSSLQVCMTPWGSDCFS